MSEKKEFKKGDAEQTDSTPEENFNQIKLSMEAYKQGDEFIFMYSPADGHKPDFMPKDDEGNVPNLTCVCSSPRTAAQFIARLAIDMELTVEEVIFSMVLLKKSRKG